MTQRVLIQADNITKKFGKREVLSSISFTVNEGECMAIIGPNGAGKSVLMSCLLGEYPLTSGQAELLNHRPTDRAIKGKVGVLLQENTIEKQLKVKELIGFQMAFYPDHLTHEEVDRLLQFTEEEKNQFADKLSGGKRRLLSFVLVLIGKPQVIFLDEPTTAMDTETRLHFWDIITELKEKGLTIFYSSHYIEEVEQMADRILVIHQGHLMRDTTPYHLSSEEKEKVFTLPLRYQSLFDDEELMELTVKSDHFSFVTKHPQVIWDKLTAAHCPIEEVETSNRSLLNRIFMNEKENKHD